MTSAAVTAPAGGGEERTGPGGGCPRSERRVYLRGTEPAERFFGAGDDELSHAQGWDVVFGGRFGRGVLNLDGEPHRAYRQALVPLLRRNTVTCHQGTITELLERSLLSLPLGTPVDLHAFTQLLAFKVAARVFAGMDEDEAQELHGLFGQLRTPPAGDLGTPGGNAAARRVGRARRRVRELLRGAVGRLEHTDGPVRRLRALPDPPPDDVIGENIAILILAGTRPRDTSAPGCCGCWPAIRGSRRPSARSRATLRLRRGWTRPSRRRPACTRRWPGCPAGPPPISSWAPRASRPAPRPSTPSQTPSVIRTSSPNRMPFAPSASPTASGTAVSRSRRSAPDGGSASASTSAPWRRN